MARQKFAGSALGVSGQDLRTSAAAASASFTPGKTLPVAVTAVADISTPAAVNAQWDICFGHDALLQTKGWRVRYVCRFLPYCGIVELLALTGQRREEVARLAWDELDLTQRIWTIPKSRTKNAKPHIVQLSDQSIAVLKRMKTQGPHVFAFHGAKTSRTLRVPNAKLTNFPRSPVGVFTICGAPACQG